MFCYVGMENALLSEGFRKRTILDSLIGKDIPFSICSLDRNWDTLSFIIYFGKINRIFIRMPQVIPIFAIGSDGGLVLPLSRTVALRKVCYCLISSFRFQYEEHLLFVVPQYT